MRIKKDDNVVVLSGSDRGKSGKVLQVLPRSEKVVVQSVRMAKVHTRPKQQGAKGQIIQKEMPIHISNIMLLCPKCSKPTRVGFIRSGEKGSSRVCKKCDATIS